MKKFIGILTAVILCIAIIGTIGATVRHLKETSTLHCDIITNETTNTTEVHSYRDYHVFDYTLRVGIDDGQTDIRLFMSK